MFRWIGYEEGPEVRTAGRENELVRLEGDSVRGQADICEALLLPELLEYVEQLVVVGAPLQDVLGDLFVNKLFG